MRLLRPALPCPRAAARPSSRWWMLATWRWCTAAGRWASTCAATPPSRQVRWERCDLAGDGGACGFGGRGWSQAVPCVAGGVANAGAVRSRPFQVKQSKMQAMLLPASSPFNPRLLPPLPPPLPQCTSPAARPRMTQLCGRAGPRRASRRTRRPWGRSWGEGRGQSGEGRVQGAWRRPMCAAASRGPAQLICALVDTPSRSTL